MTSLNFVVNPGKRGVIAAFLGLAAAFILLAPVTVAAQTDPLPSWNEGAAKTAIIEFVKATTDTASPKFVPPEARIATFDQDGTTWVSHPMYTQVMYLSPAVRRAVQDRAVRQSGGDRQALDEGPLQNSRRDAHWHVGGAVQRRGERLVSDCQASTLGPAVHRTHLCADAGGDALPACQRLQDLYRHRRRSGLRARLLRAGLWHPAGTGRRHRGRDHIRL